MKGNFGGVLVENKTATENFFLADLLTPALPPGGRMAFAMTWYYRDREICRYR